MTRIFKWLAIALAVLSLASCGLPMAAVRSVNRYSQNAGELIGPAAQAASTATLF